MPQPLVNDVGTGMKPHELALYQEAQNAAFVALRPRTVKPDSISNMEQDTGAMWELTELIVGIAERHERRMRSREPR